MKYGNVVAAAVASRSFPVHLICTPRAEKLAEDSHDDIKKCLLKLKTLKPDGLIPSGCLLILK